MNYEEPEGKIGRFKEVAFKVTNCCKATILAAAIALAACAQQTPAQLRETMKGQKIYVMIPAANDTVLQAKASDTVGPSVNLSTAFSYTIANNIKEKFGDRAEAVPVENSDRYREAMLTPGYYKLLFTEQKSLQSMNDKTFVVRYGISMTIFDGSMAEVSYSSCRGNDDQRLTLDQWRAYHSAVEMTKSKVVARCTQWFERELGL